MENTENNEEQKQTTKNLTWCVKRISQLESRITIIENMFRTDMEQDIPKEIEYKEIHHDKVKKHHKDKPWYKSIAIWFCILIVAGLLYFVYLWYMSQQGYNVILPEFMKR